MLRDVVVVVVGPTRPCSMPLAIFTMEQPGVVAANTTIGIQPWSVNVFPHRFIFQTRQFPRQLYRLDQWMFRLEHETMNVCQRNVTRFAHVECMFDKINDVFQGFGSFVSLRLQKDGRAQSQQIWTNLSHWNTDGLSSRCEDLLFFQSWSERSAFETWHGYRCHLLLHNDRVSLRETWLSPFSILLWRWMLALRSVMFIRKVSKVSKFRRKCLLTFFPIHNISIRWVTFRVMKNSVIVM